MAITTHVPILVKPIIDHVLAGIRAAIAKSGVSEGVVLDVTLGGGGHSRALLEALIAASHSQPGEQDLSKITLLSTDRDPQAIERARGTFAAELASGRMRVEHAKFSDTADILDALEKSGRPLLGLMADLGVSSDQLDQGERGLSFMRDGPLDMRMDPTAGVSARDWLLQTSEREIADTIYELSEERYSRRIAGLIVEARRAREFPKTTAEFAALVSRAIPGGGREQGGRSRGQYRIHPATRTFQAIRMVVNDEIGELTALLTEIAPRLKLGGVAAILTFHSLEDRPVKKWSREDERFKPLTKKPIEPSDQEVSENPRARSAKLRVVERVEPEPSKY